jgi:hypothetical protein
MSSIFKDCGCGCKGSKQKEKFTASLMSALLFFIVANPETFTIVRRVLGTWVASPTGAPTVLGLILHSFVFMLIVWALMNIKRENAEGSPEPPKMEEKKDDSFMGGMMGMMGKKDAPPEPIPEGAAPKPTTLPDMPAMSQPMFEPETANMVPQSPAAIPTNPVPVAKPNDGTMAKIKGMFGGSDDPASLEDPSPASYGSNWRKCACGDGTQVMILK